MGGVQGPLPRTAQVILPGAKRRGNPVHSEFCQVRTAPGACIRYQEASLLKEYWDVWILGQWDWRAKQQLWS